jgi:hypothetical protein
MCFVNSPVAIMVKRADKRCSIRMFILFTDALYEIIRLLNVQRYLLVLAYCFMAKFKLLFPLSCCDAISIFDSKQNSLHSYFPEAIVIFLLCHQFGFTAAQYLFWLHGLYVFRSKPVNLHFIAFSVVWTSQISCCSNGRGSGFD